MKIQEAILSKMPFRREGWANDGVWAVVPFPETDFVPVMETDNLAAVELTIADILADDWYVKISDTG